MACTFIHPPDPLSASSNESSFQRAYREQAAFSLIFMLALSKTLVQYMKTKYFQDCWIYSQEGCYKQHPLLKLATPFLSVSFSHMHITNVAFMPWKNDHNYRILSIRNHSRPSFFFAISNKAVRGYILTLRALSYKLSIWTAKSCHLIIVVILTRHEHSVSIYPPDSAN